MQSCQTRSVCKPRPRAYIRDLACIQGPASINTTTSDPRLYMRPGLCSRKYGTWAGLCLQDCSKCCGCIFVKFWVSLGTRSCPSLCMIDGYVSRSCHHHFHFNGHFPCQPGLAVSLQYSCCICSAKEHFEVGGTGFHMPDALPVT